MFGFGLCLVVVVGFVGVGGCFGMVDFVVLLGV